ncbi:MAG: hypothetical protein MUF60_00235 [Vicinamibacterales bacterium]|nr:hypothetical protein [Vicinamibacterales bacterium]
MSSSSRLAALLALLPLLALPHDAAAAERIPIKVERHVAGAPLTFGLPLPKGLVASPDQVRVLGPDGREVRAQVTEVSTWEPADPSLKWVWVFFFAGTSDRYTVEAGRDVRRTLPVAALDGDLLVVNNPRDRGQLDIQAGPMHLLVSQGEGGFLSEAAFDLDGKGIDESDVVAVGPQARGSFVDLLDAAGLDPARAVVHQTFIERGTGPLHAVLRVEGEYRYGRDDNNAAPFVTRIHAYAGRSYVRVLHTFVYTGVPDRHRAEPGEFPHVATQKDSLTKGDPKDAGWMQPEDQIAGAGLALSLKLRPTRTLTTSLGEGAWWDAGGRARIARTEVGAAPVSVTQLGPKGENAGPPPESPNDRRQGGFSATLTAGGREIDRAERAVGWVDVSDGSRGVAIGMRHFLEEYPKEVRVNGETGLLEAFTWSPAAGPASFARMNAQPGAEGSVENWAQGLAKTSEFVLYLHGAAPADEVATVMGYVLNPPVAHADPAWYARSGVYGPFAPRTNTRPELERALDYKFDWMLFNQRWAPWFGLFDFGDVKQRFDNGKWDMWGHNEPAQDFQVWMQFMRTGDAGYFDAALAMSRHTMDVDNTHWPGDPVYRGENNQAVDWFRAAAEPPGSKWRGIGRRHSQQHWMHVLSAHVWVQGWMASYYLAGDHRALDVARQTADMHLRRMWGEHELTGRRLYLAVWNLTEVFDATKDPKYTDDLEDRVRRMLTQARGNGDVLAIERYGYSQVYATHGLHRYWLMTGDTAVRDALVRHARRERDVPSLNHWMESYLASLFPLAIGYELSQEPSLREEAVRRARLLETAALPTPIGEGWTRAALAEALKDIDRIPDAPSWYRREFPAAARARTPNWDPLHGLRFFGWTTGHGLPWVIGLVE